MAGKTECGFQVAEIDEDCWSWRTDIISWPCVFWDVLNVNANRRSYYWRVQKNVRITKFLLEQLKNFQGGRNLTQKLSRGLTTWQVLRKSALKDVVSWRTRRHGSCTKSQLCAWMITISWKRNWNQLENCRKYAHKLSWNACTWHELVDLTFYGQWINLHDRLQNGPKLVTNAWIDLFHTFIAHVNTDNIVMWVILLNNADWDCCKIPTLQEILRTENPLLEEHCAFFGSHTFVPISWMCKKQTWVSHSSTESEIISLDAGLRLDGIPALDSSDLIVSVLGNTTQNHDRTERPVVSTSEIWSPPHTIHKRKQSRRVINDLDNVDFIPSNVQSSHQEALLCVWRQRSSDQDDHKGKTPDNETCFQNPQSCSWLVVR